MPEEQKNSYLKTVIKEVGNKKGMKIKEVYSHFGMSSSAYYRTFEGPLNEKMAEKIADFVQLPVEIVFKLHENNTRPPPSVEQLIQEHTPATNTSSPELHISDKADTSSQSKAFSTKATVFFTVFILLSGIGAYRFYTLNMHTAEFYGSGVDFSISEIDGIDSFHRAMYEYEFNNVNVGIDGNHIEITADVHTQSMTNSELSYFAHFIASGNYLNGYAAVNYQMITEPDKEVWIGVMMLRVGTTGNATGYWLTAHHDSPSSSQDGPFAFGNVNLDRLQSKITEVASQ